MTRSLSAPAWAALLLCATIGSAQTPPATQRMTPNFQNVDINDLARAVGEATGTTFIVDPRVRAQVTLINPRPMTPREFYEHFLAILQIHNAVAVPTGGGIVRIIPEATMRQLAGSAGLGATNAGPDEVIDAVLEVQNINGLTLSTTLRQLMGQNGMITPVAGTNKLLITDRAANVRRIQQIVAAVDQGSNADLSVIQLEHATAADIVRLLTSLTTGQPAAPEGAAGGLVPRVQADERANRVVISGDATQRLRIATWIASLDTPVTGGGGSQVRPLKYADAESVVATLQAHSGGIAANTGVVPAAGATPAGGGAGGAGGVIISAHTVTNSLIITAPPKMIAELMAVVDKLDIPLAQVHVEAIIADVSEEAAADLGVNWALFSNEDGTSTPAAGFISPVGSANNNPVSIVELAQAVMDPASATIAPLGGTIGIGRTRNNGLNLFGMLRAMQSDANTNVIATPSLTTTDNVEAVLTSTQEVPFITGSYTNTGGGGGGGNNFGSPFQTINRQPVGIILRVTPQINDANTMILHIDLESSELAGTSGDAGSLITNKRTVTTSVRIEDGGIIVIGGLIRDSKVSGENRVPLLGSIPIIKELFRTRNSKRGQSNLMVFIRPKILQDSLQAAIVTNSKYQHMRDAQQSQGGGRVELLPLLPGDPPLLPPLPPLPPPGGVVTLPVPDAPTP